MNDINLREIVRRTLAEDIGSGDITTILSVDKTLSAQAEIVAKQDLVAAGFEPARMTFEMVDQFVEFSPMGDDGDSVSKDQVLARLAGPAAAILTAERVALNFLMHLSGVATLTARFVEAVKPYPVRIVDTRKTIAGMRVLEKMAVRAGGGHNHRLGLYDGILIKDNHIAAAGSISEAVLRCKKGAPHTLKVEVEVTDLSGLEEALQAGADAILLDNMDTSQMAQAVDKAKGRALLEASGNIGLDNVRQVAATGIDIISIGALTHSAPACDISLNFIMEGH